MQNVSNVFLFVSIGDGSSYIVPIGSWVRVPMTCASQKVCMKICRCSNRGLSHCQPLPSVSLDNCRLHDKIVKHGKATISFMVSRS